MDLMRQAGLMQSGRSHVESKYKLSQTEQELLKIYSEDFRFKDINLLRTMKQRGFFKGIPGTATIKDILANCEVIE